MHFVCWIPRNSWNINVRQLLQNTSAKFFSKPAQRTEATKEDMSMDQVQLQKKALLSSARSLAILKSIYHRAVRAASQGRWLHFSPGFVPWGWAQPSASFGSPRDFAHQCGPDPTITLGQGQQLFFLRSAKASKRGKMHKCAFTIMQLCPLPPVHNRNSPKEQNSAQKENLQNKLWRNQIHCGQHEPCHPQWQTEAHKPLIHFSSQISQWSKNMVISPILFCHSSAELCTSTSS